MKKTELLKMMFETKDDTEGLYCEFCVVIKNDDMEVPEYIINTEKALAYKIVYYANAYNEDLELLTNPKIKIINAYPIEKSYYFLFHE